MSAVSSYPGKPEPIGPQRPIGLYVLVGCGAVILGCLLLCSGFAIWGYRFAMHHVDEFAGDFERRGYDRQTGQVIQVGESPSERTVFVCQVLKVTQDVHVDVAALCQMAEISATIHGDLDFQGQVLQIPQNGVIDGDLRIRNAQVVEIDGKVNGQITGNYMVLRYQGKTYRNGEHPSPTQAEAVPEGETPRPPAMPESAESNSSLEDSGSSDASPVLPTDPTAEAVHDDGENR